MAGPASYGWCASQGVLERLNPPPRITTEPKKPANARRSWQRERRETVKREIETFLKAEELRQAGVKKLLETIHLIDTLDTDFGGFEQFGRTLHSELETLRRKLRTTQKTFASADGGFLQTYALARGRRIRDAERWEGKGGEVDYDENGKLKVSADGDLELGDDAAHEARLKLEQDCRDIDLTLGTIWKNDVMLNTDIESLMQEAKDIKSSCNSTFFNLSVKSNDLHVRLDTWGTNLKKVVAALTEQTESKFDLERAPRGAPLGGGLSESRVGATWKG